jgi:formate dehydrogenase iron-sulfur subunit
MSVREKELAALPAGSDPSRSAFGTLVDRLFDPFRRPIPPPPKPATGFYTDTTVCIGCKACEVACKQWNQLPADGFRWSGNSYDNTGELSATSWRHVKFVEQFEEEGARGQGPGAREENGNRVSLPLTASASPPVPGEASTGSSPWSLAPGPWPLSPWLMMSDVCKHCLVAPCQQACPTGALLHNEFGNVYIQPDICNGCAYCVAACPFGVITRSSFDGHAHKCTLCYDRQRDGLVPACAKACPTGSIQFGPLQELRERAHRRVQDLHARGLPSAYLYGDKPGATYSELHSFYLLVDHPSVYGLPERPFNPWLHMGGDYLRAVAGGLVAAIALALAIFFLSH